MRTTTDLTALYAAAEAAPDDTALRLVLADCLEESEDPELVALAPGYRALVAGGYQPKVFSPLDGLTWFASTYPNNMPIHGIHPVSSLPREWFVLLAGGQTLRGGEPYRRRSLDEFIHWRDYPSVNAAEDAAALAFGLLPPELKTEYGGGPS